jgi:predicted RND superfamily exporter protein
MLKAIGVAVVCWLYMTFYMKSIFLSTCSIINICMSIPLSLLIYRSFIPYFSSIHIAIIVIIIGIGTDNIFVFHDSWVTASRIEENLDVFMKLSCAIRNGGSTMFMTTITSAMAFFACSLSEIRPVKSFGIFAAIVVLVAFLLALII